MRNLFKYNKLRCSILKMVLSKKNIEIGNLKDGLAYKSSYLESGLEKRLNKSGHPLGKPYLLRGEHDNGGSFSGKGFRFYLARDANKLDGKGTRITYRKGYWKNIGTFEELDREEIERSKHESIRMSGNEEIISIDFRFISDNLVETLNYVNSECVKYFKKAYYNYFLQSDFGNKKIHLSEIREHLKTKDISDILDFIIYSANLAGKTEKYC